MSTLTASPAATSSPPQVSPLVMRILGACALAHLINDLIQAVLPSIYPMLKANYGLSFTQVGLITLTFQLTASLLQPWIGYHTDRHPKPWLLPAGMVCTLVGILMLAFVGSFPAILLAAALVGVGSSTFHPETSRVARLASGGRYGLAQSTFQVGGNAGSALGPLLAAAIIIPYGQGNIAWFGLFAVFAILVLYGLSRWYRNHLNLFKLKQGGKATHGLSKGRVTFALVVLAVLVFSKYFYMTSLTSYFTFYLIEKFHLSVSSSQMYLFLFLGAVAVGTFAGGPIGDRIGRKKVIWFSILGAAPFTLALPYVDLFWTAVLSVVIGFVLASAFSAIVVFAQELVPGNVGMIAGIFFGLMFGFSGIGAALLGLLADSHGIEYVYTLCSFLPLVGILTILLPSTKGV
ncbi:FSR family fosmidomycin resistance protein-like MFS transporter [Pseudomonas sp. SJZ103]|uniref:MFS transporter n=1 Tax=unclassified Pseudomonas TaxID=196821 RepID=UPI00103BED29|nr:MULTISPECIES: MFS transporter [unclassified Pseudomonas]MBB6287113.1 FSR family fosmidomycin resistance protein-like MFS transporter [Pseudomonas sp. SJZ073]MBB6310960.1 FSR family fosmidomycin resistance protein-like MFS transporter [Pseudomonas sp. JAI120]MCS4311498.1 FSR family fosmidomycin resistance protein-like MFS transporter [Pseudomonas sp. BIGb0381]TWC66396.1 FSR family fosmidomycin resistance protein-like MFS transporter [Pseudomonas sp. SJZ103]TWC83036.1 FSR family fosmidomycin 